MSVAETRHSGRVTVPEDLTWRRMHPVTPLLTGWKLIVGVIAFATYQNFDTFLTVYADLRDKGVSIGHTVVVWTLLGTAGLLVIVAVYLGLSWRNRRYAVDADAVYLRSGVFYRQLRTARLPRIQSVDIIHPLLGRILGLGQLTVEVAGGGDSRVVIGYLRTADLSALRDRILDLAAGAAVGQPAHPRTTATSGGAGARDSRLGGAPGSGQVPVGPTPSTTGGGPDATPSDPAMGYGISPARTQPAPVGHEMTPDVARLRVVEPEERPLYAVDPKILLGAQLRSGTTVFAALFVVAIVVGIFVSILRWESLGAVVPALAGPLAVVGVVWSRFNASWGFRAAATPAGIRVRFGLTSDTSSTLPPGRVHGVILSRWPLWAWKDWWRVEVTVAGRAEVEASASGSVSAPQGNVLLPVGVRDTALRALWLVVPDLGVRDPDAVLDAALSGSGDDGVVDADAPAGAPERGFVRVPRRARIFSPLAWRRKAVMLTETCVILRHGRWWLRTSVIPYERIQSLSVSAGPLARRRGLAKISLDMVGGTVPSSLSNLAREDAAELARVISQRALRRRKEEKLDRWLLRASAPAPDWADGA